MQFREAYTFEDYGDAIKAYSLLVGLHRAGDSIFDGVRRTSSDTVSIVCKEKDLKACQEQVDATLSGMDYSIRCFVSH